MSKSLNKLNQRALVNIDALELFFFLLLAVCVAFQTWGFSFGDQAYFGAVVLVGILAVSKILVSRYTGKDLIVCGILLAIGIFFAFRSRRYTLLLTALLLISAKGVETRRLLSGYLWIKIFAIILLFGFAAAGVFDVDTFQHYRMTTGEFETRTLINGAATNIVHLGFFAISVIWLCLRYSRLHICEVAVLLTLDFILYFTITRSAAGVSLCALSILLIYTCSKFKAVERLILRIAPLLPFGLMLIMVLLGYAYGSSELLESINRLSTGRIAYDHYWLEVYGPTVLGSNFSELIDEGNFDDSFVYVLVIYGLVFAALLYGAVTALLVKMRREGNASGSLLIILFLVYSVVESMYPSVVVNPSLFLLGAFLFGTGSMTDGADGCAADETIRVADSSRLDSDSGRVFLKAGMFYG